jgi:hypothetical protein
MAKPPGKGYSLYSPRAALQRKIIRESRSGSQAWLALGASLWVLARIRRAVARREEVASIDVLRPGQGMLVTTIAQPSRRQRRKAEQAARSASNRH